MNKKNKAKKKKNPSPKKTKEQATSADSPKKTKAQTTAKADKEKKESPKAKPRQPKKGSVVQSLETKPQTEGAEAEAPETEQEYEKPLPLLYDEFSERGLEEAESEEVEESSLSESEQILQQERKQRPSRMLILPLTRLEEGELPAPWTSIKTEHQESPPLSGPTLSVPEEKPPPKRGRGRPKKSESSPPNVQEAKRRGRPSKCEKEKEKPSHARRLLLPKIANPASSRVLEASDPKRGISSDQTTSPHQTAPKKRGRPKKGEASASFSVSSASPSSSAVSGTSASSVSSPSVASLQEVAPLVSLSREQKSYLLQSFSDSLREIGLKLPDDVGWKIVLRADGALSILPIVIDPDLLIISPSRSLGDKEKTPSKVEERPQVREQEGGSRSYKEDEVVLDFDDASQIFHRASSSTAPSLSFRRS